MIKHSNQDEKKEKEAVATRTKTWAEFCNTHAYYHYDTKEYPFDVLLRKLWYGEDAKQDLQLVHIDRTLFEARLAKESKSFTDVKNNQLSTDQKTVFHQLFYNEHSPYFHEFRSLYQRFVKEQVLPLFDKKETEFAVQAMPTFRTQIPDATALGNNTQFFVQKNETKNNIPEEAIGWHCDSQYNHAEGEINFIVAITEMKDSNSVWFETKPNNAHYIPVTQGFGTFMSFYGNKCHHYNKVNQEKTTRISFDFRIIPMSVYNDDETKRSLTQNLPFRLGHYFTLMTRT